MVPIFFVTTSCIQAEDWANKSLQRALETKLDANRKAAVIQMTIDRDWLSTLDTLVFVNEGGTGGYWDFVTYCRNGSTLLDDLGKRVVDHGRRFATKPHYDVVYGPVSLWPQRHVMKDCDQMSFHSGVASTKGLLYTNATFGTPFFGAHRES